MSNKASMFELAVADVHVHSIRLSGILICLTVNYLGEENFFYSRWGVFFRVKRVTKMTEKVAIGVLSGVLQVSGFFTSSVANSIVGKKFFRMMPGEMVLATLDGFCKSKVFHFS